MNEDEYKGKLAQALEYFGFDASRHEDKVLNFIPDISFAGHRVDGWIEVKWCERDPSSLGAISHWTRGQEEWLCHRGKCGSGFCFLLVGTPARHFMWHHGTLARARSMPFDSAILATWLAAPDLHDLAQGILSRAQSLRRYTTS